MWHAQTTRLTVRLYDAGAGYADKAPFRAVAQVDLLGDGKAYIHAALANGRPISASEWRSLARMLRDEWGVMCIESERHGKQTTIDAVRV